MPRPLRLEFKNAWYHVMNRGAGYQDIFKTNKHRQMFLELLADASNLVGIKVHAYCLMGNHYHLLINTPRANLSRAMRHINGLYTQHFNRSIKRDGPLFRGRYKAVIVDQDGYLLQVSRYIHLNPVEAGMCEQPHRYQWSSYTYYLDELNKPHWLVTDEILSMISKKNRGAAYKKFVMEGVDFETKQFYKKANTASMFGGKKFKETHLKKLDKNRIYASKADYNRTRDLPSLDEINSACARHFNIDESDLYISGRGIKNDMRKIGMYACRMWGSEKLSKIAEIYQCQSHSNVSNAVNDIKKRLLTDKKLMVTIERLKEEIQDS